MRWSQPATVLSYVVWGRVCAAAGAILESTTTGSVALSPSGPVCVSAIHGHHCRVFKVWSCCYEDICNLFSVYLTDLLSVLPSLRCSSPLSVRPSVRLPACPLVRRSDTVSAFCSAFYLFCSDLTAFLLVAGLSLMKWSQPATVLSSVVWGRVCAAAGAILESTTTGSVALSPSCPVCVSAIHGHHYRVVKRRDDTVVNIQRILQVGVAVTSELNWIQSQELNSSNTHYPSSPHGYNVRNELNSCELNSTIVRRITQALVYDPLSITHADAIDRDILTSHSRLHMHVWTSTLYTIIKKKVEENQATNHRKNPWFLLLH